MSAGVRRLLRYVLAAACLAFVALNLANTVWYGIASLDWTGAVTELPQWSNARVVSQLIDFARSGSADSTIVSDAANSSVGQFEASSVTGRPLLFFSNYFELFYFKVPANLGGAWAAPLGNATLRSALWKEMMAHNALYDHFGVVRGPARDGGPYVDGFVFDPRLQTALLHPSRTMLLESFNSTLFNNWRKPGFYNDRLALQPYRAVRNFLIYVPSQRADSNNLATEAMIWRFEPDVFDVSKNMEAIGRYLLFHVVNPSRTCDLRSTIRRPFRPMGKM